MNKKFLYLVRLVIGFVFLAGSSTTVLGEEFYKGKMIRIVVGYNPGGGFDTFARLFARHFGRYLPGQPKVIVQNMPGAGSLMAANRVYAMQPGDGLTIVTFNFSMVIQSLVGDTAVTFDPLKYIWLGDPTFGSLPEVLYVRADLPIHTLEDLKKRKEPLALGATRKGSASGAAAEFLASIGIPVRNVYGYSGSSPTMLALERKEVDGRIIGQSAMQMSFSRFIDEGIVRPILALGSDHRLKPLPGVATLEDLKLTPDQRKLAEFMTASWSMTRLYAVPPGTPPLRVRVLREAFLNSLANPQFIKDADRLGVVIAPIFGREIEDEATKLSWFRQEIFRTLWSEASLRGFTNRSLDRISFTTV